MIQKWNDAHTHTYTMDFDNWNWVLNILHPKIHVIKICYRRLKFGWKITATLKIYNAEKILQGMTNNVRVTLIVGETTPCGLQLVLPKTNKIGDAKYTIYYSVNVYYMGGGGAILFVCDQKTVPSMEKKMFLPCMHWVISTHIYCKLKEIWVNSTQNFRLDTCS